MAHTNFKLGQFQLGTSSSNCVGPDGTNNSYYAAKFGGWKLSFESLATDDSGRSEDGIMHIYFIKNKYRKIEITMPPMSVADAYSLINKVQGRIYYIKFLDVSSNATVTLRVYTSNSSADCYSGVIGTKGLISGISFNAIEMDGVKYT